MLRGFYTAASGMVAQQRNVDMSSNNIANANTPGFKAEQSSLRAFPELLLSRMGSQDFGEGRLNNKGIVGSLNTGVYMQEAMPSMVQGDLRETGNLTDIAIWNNSMPTYEETNELSTVMFEVQALSDDGEIEVAYTRNGNFTIDGDGFLVTNDGNYVLDVNGVPIELDGDSFELGQNGEVIENGEFRGQLGIAYVEKPSDLSKIGNGLFASDNPLPAVNTEPNAQYTLKQGFIEGSNVNVQQTMTDMMNSYRMFELNQQVLKAFDQSLQKTVNEIGRV